MSGAAPAPRKKRVRKQKTEEEIEAAADAKHAKQAAEEVKAETEPPKKRTKREETATADEAAPAAGDEAMADGESAPRAAAAPGAGYLSQETLNYYKQLAAVLDKDDFENEEDKILFLTNVVEELCGSEAGKLRATTRRGVAGEVEAEVVDATANDSNNPSFVLQRLCSHAKCSHLVQKIMEIATPVQVAMFLTALQDNVVDVLSDRYGSHVLESVLFRLPALLAQEAASVAEASEATAAEQKEQAAKAAVASAARATQAWRNLGTHSESSVVDSGPDAKRTPLRAHFFTLLTRIIPEGRWITVAQHPHGSYALRHIIHILAGETNIKALADAAANTKPGASAPAISTSTTSPSYLSGLEDLLPWMTQEVSQTEADELEETTRSTSAGPVLQSLLRAIAKHSTRSADHPARVQLNTLMAKLLQFKSADEDLWTPEEVSQSTKNSVHLLLCDRSGSRLLETICSLGGVSLVSPLFVCFMQGRVLELAKHQIANFAVQHVLQSVRAAWGSRGRHLLRAVYDELTPHLQDLCSSSRTGVVLQLLDACVRVKVKENKVFKLIAGLAQSSFEDELTPVTGNVVGAILLSPIFKSALADKTSVSVIGSLMIQSCLAPGRGLQPATAAEIAAVDTSVVLSTTPPFSTVLNAFLLLPPEFILSLALDNTGSHIFDAFVAAPCALNIKQQLLRRFQMKWVDVSTTSQQQRAHNYISSSREYHGDRSSFMSLCMSPSGSFVLERLFTLAANPLKVGIAGDLCRAEKRVLASRSGALVYRKLRLEHFKRHQQSWLSSRDSAHARSTAALFADVLEDTPAAAKKTEKPKPAAQ